MCKVKKIFLLSVFLSCAAHTNPLGIGTVVDYYDLALSNTQEVLNKNGDIVSSVFVNTLNDFAKNPQDLAAFGVSVADFNQNDPNSIKKMTQLLRTVMVKTYLDNAGQASEFLDPFVAFGDGYTMLKGIKGVTSSAKETKKLADYLSNLVASGRASEAESIINAIKYGKKIGWDGYKGFDNITKSLKDIILDFTRNYSKTNADILLKSSAVLSRKKFRDLLNSSNGKDIYAQEVIIKTLKELGVTDEQLSNQNLKVAKFNSGFLGFGRGWDTSVRKYRELKISVSEDSFYKEKEMEQRDYYDEEFTSSVRESDSNDTRFNNDTISNNEKYPSVKRLSGYDSRKNNTTVPLTQKRQNINIHTENNNSDINIKNDILESNKTKKTQTLALNREKARKAQILALNRNKARKEEILARARAKARKEEILAKTQRKENFARLVARTQGQTSHFGSSDYYMSDTNPTIVSTQHKDYNRQRETIQENPYYEAGTALIEAPADVVLAWGAYPADLDSHMTGPVAANPSERFHTSFENPGNLHEAPNVLLYRDYTDHNEGGANRPEQTRINVTQPGIYDFYVHDYSNMGAEHSKAMSNSGAVVSLHTAGSRELPEGDNLGKKVKSFNIPTNKEGTVWHAFELDTRRNTIKAVNKFGNANSPEAVPSSVK